MKQKKTFKISQEKAPLSAELELRKIRKNIDAVDAEIIRLIHKRVEHVLRVGELKGNQGSAIYRPEREKFILDQILEQNKKNRFPDAALTNIFREIISACRSLEAPIRIAYFGALGSFTHEAALRIFGASSNLSSCREVGDVFEEVESEKADYGVVPVENSIEGVVNRTFDMFLTSRLGIIAESYLQVHHCLLSSEKKAGNIKKILSHPQPFAQCRAWLKRHVPEAKLVETSSTSEAAKMARGKKGVAAIASRKASETYGVPLLFENIEDNPDNVTRFAVIARECKTQRTGDDRSSVFFSIPDRPGTLETILQFIAKNGINMSKIVSRPSQRKAFEYSFFIELEGHRDDPKLAGCLAEIEKKSSFFRLVGSYPRSKMV